MIIILMTIILTTIILTTIILVATILMAINIRNQDLMSAPDLFIKVQSLASEYRSEFKRDKGK